MFAAGLIDFPQNRVVLLTAESEAPAQLLRQRRCRDAAAVEFAVQEKVKRAVVRFDYFENRVRILRVFSSPAHATP